MKVYGVSHGQFNKIENVRQENLTMHKEIGMGSTIPFPLLVNPSQIWFVSHKLWPKEQIPQQQRKTQEN